MNRDENPCARVEESLSAFLDGELPAGAAADALEHAFGCADCRRFFLAAKRLQALAGELRSASDPGGAETARRRIAAAAGARAAGRPAVAGWLRAAALVALGLGAGYALAPFATPSAPPPGAGATTAAGEMTEQRFVALAQELLSSDTKYQRTMLQVLRLVPALETGEGLGQPEDRGFVLANVEEERAPRGSV